MLVVVLGILVVRVAVLHLTGVVIIVFVVVVLCLLAVLVLAVPVMVQCRSGGVSAACVGMGVLHSIPKPQLRDAVDCSGMPAMHAQQHSDTMLAVTTMLPFEYCYACAAMPCTISYLESLV